MFVALTLMWCVVHTCAVQKKQNSPGKSGFSIMPSDPMYIIQGEKK